MRLVFDLTVFPKIHNDCFIHRDRLSYSLQSSIEQIGTRALQYYKMFCCQKRVTVTTICNISTGFESWYTFAHICISQIRNIGLMSFALTLTSFHSPIPSTLRRYMIIWQHTCKNGVIQFPTTINVNSNSWPHTLHTNSVDDLVLCYERVHRLFICVYIHLRYE